MEYIAGHLMPLKQSLGKANAYLGFLAALAVFFLALFLPWASIPVVVVGHGGISSDGWSEQAYLSVLPFAGLFLNRLPNRKALKMNIFGMCILLAFALLLVDNVEHRTTWLTPLMVDAGQSTPHMIYGSSLDVGFWLALAAMVAMSLFGLVSTMFTPADGDSPLPAAANAAGQGA
jgi:hypothetical protein